MIKNIHKLVLSALIFMAASSQSDAFMNTEQLKFVCEVGLSDPSIGNPRYAFCAGLATGILMADALEKHRICLPSNVDTKTGLETFLARAANEKDKEIEGLVTMFRAFAEKYPCN